MPRLGHKKSRLGCRQCKARHVKCDELKPCSNCARHGVSCSLVTWDPSAPQSSSASVPSNSSSVPTHINERSEDPPKPSITSTPSPSVQNEHNPNPVKVTREDSISAMSEGSSPSSQSDHFPFLTRFIHQNDQIQTDLWVRDLELMHHWTIEAYDDLSQREDMRHTWRVVAPQHAIAHPYFMHEILAFAALHKAHKLPDQRVQYYSYGVHHQDLSIRGIREKLRNVTAHEAPAIFATSTLLTLSVFASTGFEMNYPEIPSSHSAIDGILNIFNLMQGMGNVLALAQMHIVHSFLAPILQDSTDAIPSQPMLEEVLQRLPALVAFIESKPDLSVLERSVYLGVIGSLEPTLQMAQAPCMDNRELHFLFMWPMQVQPDFLNLVRQRHAGALAVVMYYTTLLFASQSRYWFMEGWGEKLMKECLDNLDPDWHPIVQWPMSFLNQTPGWNLFQNMVQSRYGPGIPLAATSPQTFAYSKGKTVELSHRQQTTSPPSSRERTTERDMGTYPQHNAISRSAHHQSAQYTKRQGPTDHAG